MFLTLKSVQKNVEFAIHYVKMINLITRILVSKALKVANLSIRSRNTVKKSQAKYFVLVHMA